MILQCCISTCFNSLISLFTISLVPFPPLSHFYCITFLKDTSGVKSLSWSDLSTPHSFYIASFVYIFYDTNLLLLFTSSPSICFHDLLTLTFLSTSRLLCQSINLSTLLPFYIFLTTLFFSFLFTVSLFPFPPLAYLYCITF